MHKDTRDKQYGNLDDSIVLRHIDVAGRSEVQCTQIDA